MTRDDRVASEATQPISFASRLARVTRTQGMIGATVIAAAGGFLADVLAPPPEGTSSPPASLAPLTHAGLKPQRSRRQLSIR